jgi:hypothetical protein
MSYGYLKYNHFVLKTAMMRQTSFGIKSSIMTNKNHVLVSCGKCCGNEQVMINQTSGAVTTPRPLNSKRIQCFTPRNATGTVSLVNTTSSTSRKITTDQNLAVIPANAIIDKIEFFGINGFATKGNFSIGLGQLNGSIMTSLIENATASIANEKVGGCREFASNAADGKNSKTLVLLQSNVNAVLEHPVTSGNLQVVIEYHLKPTPV